MSIQEDIFEDFFRRLEDAKLPPKVVSALRKLSDSDELLSKENILNVRAKGYPELTEVRTDHHCLCGKRAGRVCRQDLQRKEDQISNVLGA